MVIIKLINYNIIQCEVYYTYNEQKYTSLHLLVKSSNCKIIGAY